MAGKQFFKDRTMKVLQVNNYFSKEGGAENMMFRTAEILEKKGHQAFFFATDKQPFACDNYEYSSYFPEFVSISNLSPFSAPFYILRSIYNRDACSKLLKLLAKTKPDIVHLNNIAYQLTPSILSACEDMNIPVVMTLHNPYLTCPAVRLMINNRSYCTDELCTRGNPLPCLINRCSDSSIPRSIVAVAEFSLRKLINFATRIDSFIVPSNDLKRLAINAGISQHKIYVINNFLDDRWFIDIPEPVKGSYFLYAGRLSYEKGVDIIIEALTRLPDNLKLKITGSGTEENRLKQIVKDRGLRNISFAGFKSEDELRQEYLKCIAVIQPTRGFETFGLSIAEAFACKRPAIGARLGGIPEVIDHNINGMIFDPENADELARCMNYIHSNTEQIKQMGENARKKAETFYTSEVFYNKLIDVYNIAMTSYKRVK